MNKQEFEARQLIGKWLAKNKIKITSKMRHVHPRCYVIGYAAPACLVVSSPWMDSEPQCKEFDAPNPLTTIHRFDSKLKAGDWCAVAYICTSGTQEQVAVKWEPPNAK